MGGATNHSPGDARRSSMRNALIAALTVLATTGCALALYHHLVLGPELIDVHQQLDALTNAPTQARKSDQYIIDATSRLITGDEFRLTYGINRVSLPCVDARVPAVRERVDNLAPAFASCRS